jgi:hypothetical protein
VLNPKLVTILTRAGYVKGYEEVVFDEYTDMMELWRKEVNND